MTISKTISTTISKNTYQAIYRLLDRVSPVPYDCGELCGAACCTCTYEPEDIEFNAEGDVNADNYMGLYLLPGEDQVFEMDPDAADNDCDWIDWGYLLAEDYEFPESWTGKVCFIQCRTSPVCCRAKRPIQCRTFPLAPHIDEDGVFHMILHCDELPYDCPLISRNAAFGGDIRLNDDFVQATYTAWKHLLSDPLIFDLVEMDSEYRIEDGAEIIVMK
ncbi:MAG: hypothetical protein Q4A65_07210 [Bacillota bacterium]|nr:hypothetical protein [Bacillota bacterium]